MKYYIVGIKGVFLSSLAVILSDLGFTVAGLIILNIVLQKIY